MDNKLAKASTYTLAVAIYFDRLFDREKCEKVTICIDTRAGKGWPNTHAVRLIPFLKHSLKVLLDLFPLRLHKVLVYPVPSSFLCIWKTISKCMDPLTAKSVFVLQGVCKINAPLPVEKLSDHLGVEQLEHLEASRIASFKI